MKESWDPQFISELQQAMAKQEPRLQERQVKKRASALEARARAAKARESQDDIQRAQSQARANQRKQHKERLRTFRREQPEFLEAAREVGRWLVAHSVEPDINVSGSMRSAFLPIRGWGLGSVLTSSRPYSVREYHPAASEDNLGLYVTVTKTHTYTRSAILATSGGIYLTEGTTVDSPGPHHNLGLFHNPRRIYENSNPKYLASVFPGDDLSAGRQALLNLIENSDKK
jgi:hypothetical protein